MHKYEEIVNKSAFEGKRWRHKHAIFLIHLIKKYNLKRIAEVGVWKARTSDFILNGFPEYEIEGCKDIIETYIGIDPYRILDADYNCYVTKIGDEAYGHGKYVDACKRMSKNNQYSLLRCCSNEAAPIIQDGFFDLVYIDGDHRYERVVEDIRIWLPKIRPMGFIGGHDCDRGHPGVVQAVREIFGEDYNRAPGTVFWRQM